MNSKLLFLLVIGILITSSIPASAGLIVGPISATTNMGGSPLIHAIDQSGLSAEYVSGVTDFNTFVATTTHTSNPGTDWVSNNTSGNAVFDLGAVLLIDRAAVWNFGNGSGIPSFATRDIALDASVNGLDYINLGAFTLTNPNGAPSTLAQILVFPTTNARFVRMDILDTYGSNAAIGEVAFDAVPEPGSLFLVAASLLLILSRRRQVLMRAPSACGLPCQLSCYGNRAVAGSTAGFEHRCHQVSVSTLATTEVADA
jgi:hypothetical protein